MADKIRWTGYIPIEISEKIEEIRIKKGWTMSKAIERAFAALVEKEKDTLQNAGILIGGKEFEEVTTKSGRKALRPKEDLSL